MNPPVAIGRLTVDEQPRNRIELIAVVETERTDRRLVAKASANRIAEVAELEVEWVVPHVAAVEKDDDAEIPADCGPQLFVERQHAVAAHRQPFDQRTDLEPSPAADAGRTAE